MARLMPRRPVPDLQVQTAAGAWTLADQAAERFTMVVFYRGLHCPVCRGYIGELNRLVGDFEQRGVVPIAVSSDSAERAARARDDWELDRLVLGWGLSRGQADAWGLYRSAGRGKSSIGVEEPAEFSEPGLFLVRPDGTLYWGSVSTMPFARPHFREILKAVDFAVENDYPARGELA